MELSTCHAEPIHLSGAIQPHGILLVLERATEVILQCAGDVRALGMDQSEAIGATLSDLVGQTLAGLAQDSDLALSQEPLFLGSVTTRSSDTYDIFAHSRDQHTIVELERAAEVRPSAARLVARLSAAVARIKVAKAVETACEQAAAAVRVLAGHDRVMVYQFLDDGTGKVVAEHKSDVMGVFLNHHFPESDIPAQARELYRRNLVRVIPDVEYRPAPLGGMQPGEPVDMSDCALRSVSPVHIQYLKNMGIGASMSISLIQDETLWGLIACHSRATNYVPYEIREGCKQIGAALTQQLETIKAIDRAEEAERLSARREELLAVLAQSDALEPTLRRRIEELQLAIPSTGLIIARRGKISRAGLTPNAEACLSLIDWARRHDRTPPYTTTVLSDEFPPAREFKGPASGMLAITVNRDDPIDIVWLRAEYVETVQWAGDPDKLADGNGILTPRKSFATWLETASGRAAPWTLPEIEAAQRVREGIERIVERQQLHALQSEVIHMSRVNAMGTMASAIAHELNQPLTAIQNYTRGAARLLEADEPPNRQVTDIIGRVGEQSLRAGEIVRRLRRLVMHGATDLKANPLHEIVESACSIALLDARRLGVSVSVHVDEGIVVMADTVQVQQVLMNLVRNALDAFEGNDSSRAKLLAIEAMRAGERMISVSVTDTGPGIRPEAAERLFSTFNSTKEGGLGIGLSICRTIIEAHGGKISCEEVAGGGTRFEFTLAEYSGE